jgi:hypothetical protein
VLEAARTAYEALQSAGWLEPGGPGEQAAIRLPAHPADPASGWTDPGYRRWASSAAFNRLAYDPGLSDLLWTVMGNTSFPYPVKVARVVYPESMAPAHKGRYVHQDIGVIGVQDQFTCWLPLIDMDPDRGGLALRPGSQAGRLVRPHLLEPDAPGWATTSYRAGDALVFHCLTAHAALPNRSDRLRLSGEVRWQLADDPAPRRLVYGKRNQPVELFSRMFRGQPWWRPVPPGLRFVDRGPDVAVGIPPSRYVDVNPAAVQGVAYGHRFQPH